LRQLLLGMLRARQRCLQLLLLVPFAHQLLLHCLLQWCDGAARVACMRQAW
jgi:hypothetical protein